MDEKIVDQIVERVSASVSNTVAEVNAVKEEYEKKIAELNTIVAEKEAKLAELNESLNAANEAAASKDQELEAKNAELNELKETNASLEKEKKVSELNEALSEFSEDECNYAKEEIEAFKADPAAVEINSITSKICVEMVRKNRESNANHEPDIFGGISGPEDHGDVDIFG